MSHHHIEFSVALLGTIPLCDISYVIYEYKSLCNNSERNSKISANYFLCCFQAGLTTATTAQHMIITYFLLKYLVFISPISHKFTFVFVNFVYSLNFRKYAENSVIKFSQSSTALQH